MTTMSDRDYARVVKSLRGVAEADIDTEAYRAEIRRRTAAFERIVSQLQAANDAMRKCIAEGEEQRRRRESQAAARVTSRPSVTPARTSAELERNARLDRDVEQARAFRHKRHA